MSRPSGWSARAATRFCRCCRRCGVSFVADRRSALHQPMGPRLPARVPPARAAAPAASRRQPARVHGHGDGARAPRHRDAARPRRPDRVRRLVRSAQPDLSRAPARDAEEAARRRARAPPARSRHRLLHVAPRSGCARRVADARSAIPRCPTTPGCRTPNAAATRMRSSASGPTSSSRRWRSGWASIDRTCGSSSTPARRDRSSTTSRNPAAPAATGSRPSAC